jgi:hypothetical protein
MATTQSPSIQDKFGVRSTQETHQTHVWSHRSFTNLLIVFFQISRVAMAIVGAELRSQTFSHHFHPQAISSLTGTIPFSNSFCVVFGVLSRTKDLSDNLTSSVHKRVAFRLEYKLSEDVAVSSAEPNRFQDEITPEVHCGKCPGRVLTQSVWICHEMWARIGVASICPHETRRTVDRSRGYPFDQGDTTVNFATKHKEWADLVRPVCSHRENSRRNFHSNTQVDNQHFTYRMLTI